jgi:hypothetical protein
MKTITLSAAVVLSLILMALPIGAHHSTNSVYDETKTIEVTGKVLEWQFVNPHPYLMVEGSVAGGKVEKWDLSFGGSAVVHMTRTGYTKETFKVGETVIARGSPARNESVRGLLIRGNLTRPDGKRIP